MFFCRKCNNFSPSDKCGFCGAKKLREAQQNDPVHLDTKSFVYAGMLEETLKQNGIPFIKQEKHGGIMKYVGFGGVPASIEEFKFYVPLGAYEKAKELLAGLFGRRGFRPAENPKHFKQGKRRINTKTLNLP